MKYIQKNNLNLSRFSLGTVQLGIRYGLGEHAEKPSEQEAFAILDRAMECGVNNLDTANNYGDSEAVIGRWLQKRRSEGKELPWIVTKVGPFKHDSLDILRDDILYQVESCRKNLGVDTIDCLMLHNFEDYEQDPDTIRKVFEELKRQKAYEMSAISAYSHHDYGAIADSGFDATQLPINVFDWSKIDDGGIEKIKNAGMSIFARSVFLQGMVFHTPEDLDPKMDFCFPALREYLRLAKEFGLRPEVLALSFVLSLPGVTTAVLGCDTPDQVAANCALFDATVSLSEAQLEQLHNAFRNIDRRMINPALWPK